MKPYPIVSITGRQNVGKSTLFNCIAQKNIAITHDFPGVTRDIIEHIVEKNRFEKKFLLCDTPGLDVENVNELTANIIETAFEQLINSDLILYVMDRNELTEYDYKLIEMFKKDKRFNSKVILYIVNKIDNPEGDYELEDFYRLGLQEILPMSALGRRNVSLLYEKMNFFLQSTSNQSQENDIHYKIAIVGKPNSGKSSFLNSILGFQRSVVSEVAGTTRDSVNALFQYNEKNIEIVDTAGIRKQGKNSKDSVEFYSYNRAIKSIDETDIVVHIVDATKGIGEFDKKIFSLIREKSKPIVLAVNKWDLIQNKENNTFMEYKSSLVSRFPPVKDIPIVSISSLSKQRVTKILEECEKIYQKINLKIPTSEINQKMNTWLQEGKITSKMKKRPKLFYITQVSSSPFKLIAFVNYKEYFKSEAIAYLKKKLRETYGLQGFTIQIELRSDRESIKRN